MKHYLLLIATLFVSHTATCGGNVPGYQGKKFIIKYDCGIMHPFLMGRTGKLPELYHNLSMDYVVSRAWSVGGKYGFMHYNAPADKKTFYGDSYYNGYSGDIPLSVNDYKGRYMQHTVAFIAKHYYKRRGYIAPIGRYLSLGVYYQYTSQHLSVVERTQLSNPFYNEYEYNVKRYTAVTHWGGFILGMGRSMVVAKRMVIDVGFNLNIAPWPAFVFSGNGDTLKSAAYRELLLRNIFQVYLGFGALAF